jgi:hypothetical protein
MTPANDNGPIRADDFSDSPEGLAARRAFLAQAPATHANHREVRPVETWAKREKDEATFLGLRLWCSLNEPPCLAANDNNPEHPVTWPDGRPFLPDCEREMETYKAKQLLYAHDNGMTRWVGNKLVKLWDGHKWVDPDEEFTTIRVRPMDRADVENFDAEIPDAQMEMARALDVERLRARLGHKVTAIMDMASSGDTLAEIGEYLGFAGQYAARMAGKEVRAAVTALNAAVAEEERAAA